MKGAGVKRISSCAIKCLMAPARGAPAERTSEAGRIGRLVSPIRGFRAMHFISLFALEFELIECAVADGLVCPRALVDRLIETAAGIGIEILDLDTGSGLGDIVIG